ncbi:hypothetical protein VR010_03975 [Actinomycetaceae bacterium L2_0104]
MSSGVLEEYGAFDISLASDLPLFIDPFLLFDSDKPEYQILHGQIIKYLKFLRDRSGRPLTSGDVRAWYKFGEVKQNWLGFTVLGNSGSGLGPKFARALHSSLGSVLANFGSETVTEGSHLEKLTLIGKGIGRDNISDFTTNLIKGFLLEYTQKFALTYLTPEQRGRFQVERAEFSYQFERWMPRSYVLPRFGEDFVLLTPEDILTRDDTWINRSDLYKQIDRLPEAIPDDQLRAEINNYFSSKLSGEPTKEELEAASSAVLQRYPELIDYYIKEKEDDGARATARSAERRADTRTFLVDAVKRVVSDLSSRTTFYSAPVSSYDEALERVRLFKHYVEDQDGYRLLNRPDGKRGFSNEKDVQLFFGLAFAGSQYDVNREANNGRGPVDFKISNGAYDKTLIEVKLASNPQLKRNLVNQVEVYQRANATRSTVKMIVCYTAAEVTKVEAILIELRLRNDPSIVVIDARSDNKPSGSKA